jgi:hypothetical protein
MKDPLPPRTVAQLRMTASIPLLWLHRSLLCLSCLATIHIGIHTAFSGNFWKEAGNAVGGVVKTGVKGATAPVEVLRNAAKVAAGQEPPRSIYKPYVDLSASAGQTVEATANAASIPREEIYQRVQQIAERQGSGTAFLFDLGTYANRYGDELEQSAARAAANTLQGRNPLYVLAAPLAAAIRSAHERYDSDARSLPGEVIEGLKGHFRSDILSHARYVVGNVEITLPTIIGKGKRFMDGSDYAVVADDIIVFNVDPPSFSQSPGWWAHEVTHVEQYVRWGIDRFAFEYLKDFGSKVEGEANRKGSAIANQTLDEALTSVPSELPEKPVPTSVLPVALSRVTAPPSADEEPRRTRENEDNFAPSAKYPPNRNNYSPPTPATERYICQCIFPYDPYPMDYLVTERSRIIMVERATGRSMQIGWALAPTPGARNEGIEWLYTVNNYTFGVTRAGSILTSRMFPNGYRDVSQIGYVRSF